MLPAATRVIAHASDVHRPAAKVAELCGVHRSFVHAALARHAPDLLAARVAAYPTVDRAVRISRECATCGRAFDMLARKPHRYCSRKCQHESMRGVPRAEREKLAR